VGHTGFVRSLEASGVPGEWGATEFARLGHFEQLGARLGAGRNSTGTAQEQHGLALASRCLSERKERKEGGLGHRGGKGNWATGELRLRVPMQFDIDIN
jgi:hypothetical protein